MGGLGLCLGKVARGSAGDVGGLLGMRPEVVVSPPGGPELRCRTLVSHVQYERTEERESWRRDSGTSPDT